MKCGTNGLSRGALLNAPRRVLAGLFFSLPTFLFSLSLSLVFVLALDYWTRLLLLLRLADLITDDLCLQLGSLCDSLEKFNRDGKRKETNKPLGRAGPSAGTSTTAGLETREAYSYMG